VLGNLLELTGFEQDTPEAVRAEALPSDVSARLSNDTRVALEVPGATTTGSSASRTCRSISATRSCAARRRCSHERCPSSARPHERRHGGAVRAHRGDRVRLRQGEGAACSDLQVDERVARGASGFAAAHVSTAALGRCSGRSAERA